MLKNFISLAILSMVAALNLSISSKAQGEVQPAARLIYRFEQRIEYPADYDVITKAVQELSKYVSAKNSSDRVAIRLCSNEPVLRAFYTAAASPWKIQGHMVTGGLIGWHKTLPERTLVLRSTDCAGDDARVAAVELWALPKVVTPPPFVEAMKFCQLNFHFLAANQLKGIRPYLIKRREYESALRKLIAKLRANPRASGFIQGYFLRERTAVSEQHLSEVHSFMARHKIPQDRYVVRLSQFGGDFSPSTPEPEYPDVYAIYLTRQCKRN